MMQAAELQIWRSFEWPCPLRHASLRRQHDLIGKLAIESALAVLSFAPCHMCVAAGRNRPQHDRVLELADIRLAAARGNRSDVGVAPIRGLWRVRLDIPPAGLVPGHDPSARALQRRQIIADFSIRRPPLAPFENGTGTRVKSLLRSKMPCERDSYVSPMGRRESRRATSTPRCLDLRQLLLFSCLTQGGDGPSSARCKS
jgi:hypothetical protein